MSGIDSRPVSGYGTCLRGDDGAGGLGLTPGPRSTIWSGGVDSGFRRNDGAGCGNDGEDAGRTGDWAR